VTTAPLARSDLGIVHEETNLLSALACSCEATGPPERVLERVHLDDRKSADHGFPFRKVTQAHRAISAHDRGLLSEEAASRDPHTGLLRIPKNSMSCFSDLREIITEVVHGAIIERNQKTRHGRMLTTRQTGDPPAKVEWRFYKRNAAQRLSQWGTPAEPHSEIDQPVSH